MSSARPTGSGQGARPRVRLSRLLGLAGRRSPEKLAAAGRSSGPGSRSRPVATVVATFRDAPPASSRPFAGDRLNRALRPFSLQRRSDGSIRRRRDPPSRSGTRETMDVNGPRESSSSASPHYFARPARADRGHLVDLGGRPDRKGNPGRTTPRRPPCTRIWKGLRNGPSPLRFRHRVDGEAGLQSGRKMTRGEEGTLLVVSPRRLPGRSQDRLDRRHEVFYVYRRWAFPRPRASTRSPLPLQQRFGPA